MNKAIEKLDELDKAVIDGKFNYKIFSEDQAVDMVIDDTVFIGKKVLTHYYKNHECIYHTMHFTSSGCEYLVVGKTKEFAEPVERPLICKNFKPITP